MFRTRKSIAARRAGWFVAATVFLSIISSCGGSGGNGSSSGPAPTANVVSGRVVDAFVAGASVTAYQVNANGTPGSVIAGPVTTDSSGNYSLNLGTYSGPVYLTSTGGTYIDTASGATINVAGSGLTLSAIVPAASGSITAQITPMTTMAAQAVPALLSSGIGATVAAAATDANALISNYFGISNILNTALLDLTQAGCASGASAGSINASMILAGISQLAVANGVSTPSLMQALIQDVTSDGRFDGKASGTAINVPLSPGPGQIALSTIEGGALTGLASAVTAFTNSASNACKAAATQIALAALSNPGIFSVPAAPTGVAVTPGNGQVTVSWNPVSGSSSYNLYVATASGVQSVPSGLPGYASYLKVSSPYVLSGLSNGTAVYIVVTAVNGSSALGSESPISAQVSATPSGSMGVSVAINQTSPQTVSANGTINFTATVSGSTNQTVTWSVQPASGCGTISTTGQYTAPASAATCTVAAASVVAPNPSTAVTVNVTGVAVTLSSIAILPSNPTINVGATQQFSAKGTYSDQSTLDLTTQASWASANTAAATIGNQTGSKGLATGVAAGSSAISATMGSIVGQTQITVAAPSRTAVALSTGANDVYCATMSDGSTWCWGFDLFGNLGDGRSGASVDAVPTPVLSTNLPAANPAKSISAGAATCAVLTDGTIQCWGSGSGGLLGNGTTTADSTAPVTAYNNPANPAKQVSVGALACALFQDGTIDCWGGYPNGSFGELGNGTATTGYSLTPVAVSTITPANPATSVSAGNSMACAVMANGTVECWGDNTWGELGNGTFTGSSPCGTYCISTPVTVTGLSGVTAVSAVGNSATYPSACALKSDGTVWCWGYGFGYITHTGIGFDLPYQVSIPPAKAVSVGGSACALLTNGTVMCWGVDSNGQLGNGSASPTALAPILVSNITTANPATAITVGLDSACALLQDGTVWCWGNGLYGNLGNGTTASTQAVPVQVTGL